MPKDAPVRQQREQHSEAAEPFEAAEPSKTEHSKTEHSSEPTKPSNTPPKPPVNYSKHPQWNTIPKSGTGLLDKPKEAFDSCPSPIGQKNVSLTCYYLTAIQMLMSCPSFIEAIKETKGWDDLIEVYKNGSQSDLWYKKLLPLFGYKPSGGYDDVAVVFDEQEETSDEYFPGSNKKGLRAVQKVLQLRQMNFNIIHRENKRYIRQEPRFLDAIKRYILELQGSEKNEWEVKLGMKLDNEKSIIVNQIAEKFSVSEEKAAEMHNYYIAHESCPLPKPLQIARIQIEKYRVANKKLDDTLLRQKKEANDFVIKFNKCINILNEKIREYFRPKLLKSEFIDNESYSEDSRIDEISDIIPKITMKRSMNYIITNDPHGAFSRPVVIDQYIGDYEHLDSLVAWQKSGQSIKDFDDYLKVKKAKAGQNIKIPKRVKETEDDEFNEFRGMDVSNIPIDTNEANLELLEPVPNSYVVEPASALKYLREFYDYKTITMYTHFPKVLLVRTNESRKNKLEEIHDRLTYPSANGTVVYFLVAIAMIESEHEVVKGNSIGHYWAYVFRHGSWYEANDTKIERVNKYLEIDEYTTKGPIGKTGQVIGMNLVKMLTYQRL
jgi:hypothetical protein